MKLAVMAFSRRGCDTARRAAAALPGEEKRLYTVERLREPDFAPIPRPSRDFYGEVFAWADAMVFVGACGIAVREIAPHVRSKRTDPAVLCVDELGRFVISLLSGHIGGANDLACQLAEALGAVPVVTTATDLNRRFSVDAWAARAGLHIAGMAEAKAVSAAILEGDVPLVSDFPIVGALPPGVVPGEAGEVGICLSCREKAPFDRTLLLVPRALRLGLGCRRGTPADQIAQAVDRVLAEHKIHPAAVGSCASIDLKAEEPGLLDFCARRGWPVRFYTAAELAAVPGAFTSSAFVKSVTGVDNVCERAALMGGGRLIVRKTAMDGVTVALAEDDWEVRF